MGVGVIQRLALSDVGGEIGDAELRGRGEGDTDRGGGVGGIGVGLIASGIQ